MLDSAGVLRELAGSILSKALDPMPIVFRTTDDVGVGPVRNGCKKPIATLHTFRKPLNRNAFLFGCAEYTDLAKVEHLIVGFGRKRGTTTLIDRMSHAIGSQDAVVIPGHIASAIEDHVQQEHGNEVLIFHNHPRNPFNVILDNLPMPSANDRQALKDFYNDAKILGKSLFGGGRIRFYIGENGYVQEFRTPDLLSLIEEVMTNANR